MQRALIVGLLVAPCAALLGISLVLRRYAMIGDGLSHVAFGAMSVAAVVGLTNEMTVVLPVTILCAVLLLCSGQRAKIKGDAAVAMISVSALAVGYMVMSIFALASPVRMLVTAIFSAQTMAIKIAGTTIMKVA